MGGDRWWVMLHPLTKRRRTYGWLADASLRRLALGDFILHIHIYGSMVYTKDGEERDGGNVSLESYDCPSNA